MLEVLREDFVRAARAKGLTQRAALWGHVLRNAMIPVVTVMGLQFANLLAGTIVVENVFYLPGLGRLIFQSISNRDLIVVRNCVMLLAAMVVIVNLTLGMITPPVGGLLFVTSVATRVSITDLTREMPLFLLAHFVVLCLLTFIPALSTWLPHTLGFQ